MSGNVALLIKSISQIIEFIGDVNFMYNTYTIDALISDFYLPKGLRCFQDSTIGFYDFGIVDSCEWWTDLGVVKNESLNFELFPNPANDILFVRLDEQLFGELLVLDLTGKKLKCLKIDKNSFDYDLDISDLNYGTYFIEIHTDRSSSIKRFVKY